MSPDLATLLIRSKRECIFISPHLDDAILSCGSLLLSLASNVPVTIITVYTAGHEGPYTLSARKFLATSGYPKDAKTLYSKRREEDSKVCQKLNATVIHLGLQDALFRRKSKKSLMGNLIPELDHLYPTYRFHMSSPSPYDDSATRVHELLKAYVHGQSFIFIPYGIGKHVDHLLTRKACEGLTNNSIHYADFPYTVRTKQYGVAANGEHEFEFPVNAKKEYLIRQYVTQVKGLFPDGKIPDHTERYFTSAL